MIPIPTMRNISFVAVFLVAGCGVHWRPASDGPAPPTPAAIDREISDAAAEHIRVYAANLASVARTVSDRTDAGEFQSHADFVKAAAELTLKARKEAEAPAFAKVDRLAHPQGNWTPADTSKAWRSLADGWERASKGKP